MPCYRPVKAWFSGQHKSGKPRLVFKAPNHGDHEDLEVPCGRCIGCRLEKSKAWAVRILHEASLYNDNCFVTLTYDDDNLPADGSLVLSHYQEFQRALKRHLGVNTRFFHCGEYGDERDRPHYHAVLFDLYFPDKQLFSTNDGNPLFTSKILDEIWGRGHCTIGEVTFESAAYVGRYAVKKITGNQAEEHYQGRKPEYATMSRRPGIGYGFYLKYKDDLFPDDFVVVRGHQVKVPRYYDKLLEGDDPVMYDRVKRARRERAVENELETRNERLHAREVVAQAALDQKRRKL